MPHVLVLAGAIAASLAFSASARAQQFTDVVSFGDSLSDAGNVAALLGRPAGNSFTTNPDPVFTQIVAGRFGFDQTNSGIPQPGVPVTGDNYAWGGGCVHPTGACINPFAFSRVDNQITAYLAGNSGRADANALYTYWGGANDIFARINGWTDQAQIAADMTAIADAAAAQVGRLQDAGARYVLVLNLPDIGRTPDYAGTANAGNATFAVATYNDRFNQGLGALGDGIVPINANGLFDELLADPAAYGFSNVTDRACNPPDSVSCGPEGSGQSSSYAPGTNQTWLFADGVHPTGAAHALLAEVVLATLAAPQQVALLAETPILVYDVHAGALRRELLAARGEAREDGSVSGYATLDYAEQTFAASGHNPETDSRLTTLSIGADYRIDERWGWGVAASIAGQNADFERGGATRGDLEANAALFSAFATLNFGGGYLHGIVSGGSTDYDVERRLDFRASTRTESGDTTGSHYAAELDAGWLFESGGLQHGPFLGVAWQSAEINGYREDGGSSTAMRFDDFERDSLVWQAGYQLSGSFGDGVRGWHPYLRIAYARESEDEATAVRAGSTTMNGQFVLPGYVPSDDWISADLGLGIDFTERCSGFIGYRGRFSDDALDSDSLNIGLRITL